MKGIFIHVGPPKTGSSAIQKFLASNQELLKNLGIYYPHHALDKNGISSGNAPLVFASTGKKVIDKDKVDLLLQDFHQNSSEMLLLSSEAFFDRMDELSKALPGAKFIYYLRSPLDYMESTYNQSVKRTGNSQPLEITTVKPDMSKILELEKYLDIHGSDNLELRFYHNSCFAGGNLISDFFDALKISNPKLSSEDLVNPSYSFEALQFKRYLNKLDLSDYCQYRLDSILQSHDGTMDYSLIEPEQYSRLRDRELETLESFAVKHKLQNFQGFLSALKNAIQKPYQKQELQANQWLEMADYLWQSVPDLYMHLAAKMKSQRSLLPKESQNFYEHQNLLNSLWYQAYFNTRRIINAFYIKFFQ